MHVLLVCWVYFLVFLFIMWIFLVCCSIVCWIKEHQKYIHSSTRYFLSSYMAKHNERASNYDQSKIEKIKLFSCGKFHWLFLPQFAPHFNFSLEHSILTSTYTQIHVILYSKNRPNSIEKSLDSGVCGLGMKAVRDASVVAEHSFSVASATNRATAFCVSLRKWNIREMLPTATTTTTKTTIYCLHGFIECANKVIQKYSFDGIVEIKIQSNNVWFMMKILIFPANTMPKMWWDYFAYVNVNMNQLIHVETKKQRRRLLF